MFTQGKSVINFCRCPRNFCEGRNFDLVFSKIQFFGIKSKILEIRKIPQEKKCEEFFSGQNGVEISAEISTGAEYSTKIEVFSFFGFKSKNNEDMKMTWRRKISEKKNSQKKRYQTVLRKINVTKIFKNVFFSNTSSTISEIWRRIFVVVAY